MTPQTFLVLILVAGIVCTAGCTMTSPAGNKAPGSSNVSPQSIAKYRQTLAQPEESAKMIKMDTDIYNPGEVVEFVVINEKDHSLSCSTDPPSFSVRYQKTTGQWVTRMGTEVPAPGNTTTLKPGESAGPYRFVTEGWAPGRYRIVSECGVSREILVRAPPVVSPVRPACPEVTNVSPFIQVNAISDQIAGDPFTISGTTNLAAGEKLQYSIFTVRSGTSNITAAKLVSSEVKVSMGSCGINTWSVDGVIEVPGNYFIGISNGTDTVSAIKRFSVLPGARATDTMTTVATMTAPGIISG